MLQVISKASLISVFSVKQPPYSISFPISNISLISSPICHHQLSSSEGNSLNESSDIQTTLGEIEDTDSMRQGILPLTLIDTTTTLKLVEASIGNSPLRIDLSIALRGDSLNGRPHFARDCWPLTGLFLGVFIGKGVIRCFGRSLGRYELFAIGLKRISI